MVIHLTDDEREALVAVLREVIDKAFPRSPREPVLMSVIRKLTAHLKATDIHDHAGG